MKINATEEWTEVERRRDGSEREVTYVKEYLGDVIRFDVDIELNEVFPDFSKGEDYDRKGCKDYLFDKLIEYLQTNRESVIEKMSTSDWYCCGYNILECGLYVRPDES